MYHFKFKSRIIEKNVWIKSKKISVHVRETGVKVFKNKTCIIQGKCTQHSNDLDVKLIGQKIALSNAIEKLSRKTRTKIWKDFFERSSTKNLLIKK